MVKIRRFVAVDDCGNIINPMIVDGQIHGGLTMGMAPALLEEISYDENGNIQGGSFMDYLVPTAMETPSLGDRQDGDARRRTIRSAPRGWASRRRSARRRPSPTPWSTPWPTSASRTSTSRSRPRRSGGSSRRRESPSRRGLPVRRAAPRADRVREDRSRRWSSSRSDCRSACSGRSSTNLRRVTSGHSYPSPAAQPNADGSTMFQRPMTAGRGCPAWRQRSR